MSGSLGAPSAVSGAAGRFRLSPRFPFDPRRLPVFYGWVVAFLGTVAILFSIPGQTMGVSVFTEELLAVTGLTRLQFSNAYLLGTVGSGLLLPAGGRLLDRFGARVVGAAASLALAAVLVLLSLVDSLAATLPGGGSAIGVFLLLSILFTVLRFSGQGMLTLTGRTMMARWFDRFRGLVSACSGALISFGFSVAPMLLLAWIEHGGWRVAWREMAALLASMGVIALLTFRDRPEECGLEMDGGSGEVGAEGGRISRSRALVELAPRAAISTRAFWVVTFALANLALVGTAITFHIVDLGEEAGMAPEAAVRIFLPVAVVSVGVGFLVGYLVDRGSVLTLIRFMLITEVVMFAAAAHLGHPGLRGVAVVAWGIASGFYGPMTAAALPRLFGRRHLGTISGVMTSTLVIFSALGPAILAFARQRAGSYGPALYLCAALPLLVLLFGLGAREPAGTDHGP